MTKTLSALALSVLALPVAAEEVILCHNDLTPLLLNRFTSDDGWTYHAGALVPRRLALAKMADGSQQVICEYHNGMSISREVEGQCAVEGTQGSRTSAAYTGKAATSCDFFTSSGTECRVVCD